MQNVGTHGLLCPEPDDYGAVALYMQNLGTIIDAQLQQQIEALQTFSQDRPTIIVTNSATATIASSTQYSNLFDTVLFNNSSFMSFDVGGGFLGRNVLRIGSEAGAPITVPYLQGSYSIGCTTTETATGAITTQSERVTDVRVLDDTINPVQEIAEVFDVTWDMGTGGGESQVVKFSVVLDRVSGVNIEVFVEHLNVASTVTYALGALLWVTYNGPTDIIEVA